MLLLTLEVFLIHFLIRSCFSILHIFVFYELPQMTLYYKMFWFFFNCSAARSVVGTKAV